MSFESVSRFGAWRNSDNPNLNDLWMKIIFFISLFWVFGALEGSKLILSLVIISKKDMLKFSLT